jgi:alkylation response protein AidB-like acyl-CoA dehydrogenase
MFKLPRTLCLFALALPAEYGGTGPLASGCLAAEEFGRVGDSTPYLLTAN